MEKFSFNSFIRKQPPKGVFIEAIRKSWHRHLSISIVIGIGFVSALQKSNLCFIFFLNGTFLFFPSLSYGHTLRLISLRFSIHPSKGVYWSSRKRQFQLSEASILWCFEKRTTPKIFAYFAYFPTNWKLELTKGGVIFKYTRRPSWDFSKSSLEKLFCRELASACFAEK